MCLQSSSRSSFAANNNNDNNNSVTTQRRLQQRQWQRQRQRLLYACCLALLLLHVGGSAAALDWQQVKPMYLVSMYPGPLGMALQSTKTTSLSAELDAEMSATNNDDSRISSIDDSSAADDTSSAAYSRGGVRAAMEPEPLVLNLETTPLLDSMLPEGAMAMDRIFGGDVGNPHCFPYQVGMLLQRPKGLYWCGGSLISDQHVLTAAHCVDM